MKGIPMIDKITEKVVAENPEKAIQQGSLAIGQILLVKGVYTNEVPGSLLVFELTYELDFGRELNVPVKTHEVEPPAWRVFAKVDEHKAWWVWNAATGKFDSETVTDALPRELYPIKNPRNDPEAIAIIQEAKNAYAYGLKTVEEARDKKVCRICGGPANPRKIGYKVDSFVYDFGKEYAHRSCLDAIKNEQVK